MLLSVGIQYACRRTWWGWKTTHWERQMSVTKKNRHRDMNCKNSNLSYEVIDDSEITYQISTHSGRGVIFSIHNRYTKNWWYPVDDDTKLMKHSMKKVQSDIWHQISIPKRVCSDSWWFGSQWGSRVILSLRRDAQKSLYIEIFIYWFISRHQITDVHM